MDESKEPSADQREGAANMFGMYNALRLSGFTEMQACVILGTWLGTAGRS